MIAALPMYDWPEIRWATDQFWEAIIQELAGKGIDAPMSLSRNKEGLDLWLKPELLLSQTCGFPFKASLEGKVKLVAAPVYTVEGCQDHLYSSWIVVRKDSDFQSLSDLRGSRFAFNSIDSQSGYNCIRAMISDLAEGGAFFSDTLETGGHRASLQAVYNGAADVAAVDALCWDLAQAFDPTITEKLHPIAQSPLVPALPFITSLKNADKAGRLRHALQAVIGDNKMTDACAALRLTGVVSIESKDYDPIATQHKHAKALNYPWIR